jgi:hypothetical protein
MRRLNTRASVLLFDSAKRPGAKILVSGGGRCNVTNTVVADSDFWGGSRTIVRRILRALPVHETVAFFYEIGVPLHEEADGKMFPDTNRARDVLEALLREGEAAGVRLHSGHRVLEVTRTPNGFLVSTSRGYLHARRVVLATGGRSLPKTGSDGAGYAVAKRLGHTIVETTPGLAPLVLGARDDGGESDGSKVPTPLPLHRRLSGVSHDAELAIWIDGSVATRLRGSLLWTHFGISGPVALNASRHWARAGITGRHPLVTMSFCPGHPFPGIDQRLAALATERPKASLATALSTMIPASVATAILERLGIKEVTLMAHLSRNDRHRLAHALVAWKLPIVETRGYQYAEVTAGGVSLAEIDPATMESRVCPGLYLVGEILDVDGRIGGFNFQWAWSSAYVAARALAGRPVPAA